MYARQQVSPFIGPVRAEVIVPPPYGDKTLGTHDYGIDLKGWVTSLESISN